LKDCFKTASKMPGACRIDIGSETVVAAVIFEAFLNGT
jgi:hypothetical protein